VHADQRHATGESHLLHKRGQLCVEELQGSDYVDYSPVVFCIQNVNCLQEMEIKALLRDEMQTYSYQFKTAATVFNKEQVFYYHVKKPATHPKQSLTFVKNTFN
jgi:hypothetical protein